MTSSLDPVLPVQFTPATVEEYLALQLARRLGDESSVSRYIPYTEHYPARHLLHLVYQAKRQSDPVSTFHSSLMPSDT